MQVYSQPFQKTIILPSVFPAKPDLNHRVAFRASSAHPKSFIVPRVRAVTQEREHSSLNPRDEREIGPGVREGAVFYSLPLDWLQCMCRNRWHRLATSGGLLLLVPSVSQKLDPEVFLHHFFRLSSQDQFNAH